MIKRIYSILALAMACMLFAGCHGQNAAPAATEASKRISAVGSIPTSFPLAATPESLKIIITGFDGRDQENVLVWQEYEKMTGVNVDWTTLTKETRTEYIHTALMNDQQYDLIMRCKLSATRLLRYGSSGLILDLAKGGLLQRCAPNCWAYLQSHPDTLASVMNPDGTIYALPQVNSGAELRVAQKLFVNKRWLERVNMELPTTLEELRELLVAFKHLDANGNGDPNDEIPLCSAWDSISMALYGSYGLANRGYHNANIDCDPATGSVRLIAKSVEYREFLEFFNDLYMNGLIDSNLYSISLDQIAGNAALDKIGSFVNTNLALLPASIVGDWVAVDEALTGPHGDKLWSAVRANFHSTGAAVIPAACRDPELVLRWLDYFWTDEGTLFYHMGVEGETYTQLEDGTYDYLPEIYDEMAAKNLSFDTIVSEYSPYPGGSNPTVEIAPYFMGGEMAREPARAARALMEYAPEECWPSFTFTQEENDILDEIKGDIEKYSQSMLEDFISGARSFDEWDAYTAKLDELGADKMLSVYQAAVDRYHSLSTALN